MWTYGSYQPLPSGPFAFYYLYYFVISSNVTFYCEFFPHEPVTGRLLLRDGDPGFEKARIPQYPSSPFHESAFDVNNIFIERDMSIDRDLWIYTDRYNSYVEGYDRCIYNMSIIIKVH